MDLGQRDHQVAALSLSEVGGDLLGRRPRTFTDWCARNADALRLN